MAVIVSDASPLVHLATISRFDVLRILYTTLIIPPAVMAEVAIAGRGRPGAAELQAALDSGWIIVVAPTNGGLRPETSTLDRGEAEALTVALEMNATVVLIDEIRGRGVARQLGLRAIGTLGVLIEAKRRGVVNSFREELSKLERQSQLQLSAEIRESALRMADEEE